MNLFLDTETTGLPPKNGDWKIDYMEYPYIVSIAWEHKGVVRDFIIHQEGRKIPLEATKVHGVTTKMANDPDLAQPASFVFDMLMCDAKEAANIIGHNVYFDVSIIKANVLKIYGPKHKKAKLMDEAFDKDKRIDTMRNSVRLFNRWPKLKELYEYLFNGETFDAHSAKEDMLACKRCYFELKKRKVL